jgi:hypothetical protein
VPVILWDTHIVEQEHESVQTFWMVGEEVKNPPILLDVGLGVGFESMDHVWKFHRITDEEDGEIVSHKIPITLSANKKEKILTLIK